MIVRKIIKQKLKPECVEEYIKAHNEIWPELVEEYKNGGVLQCNCYIDGTDLYVFVEQDDEVKTDYQVDPKWQEYMRTLLDLSVEPKSIEEVFKMNL